MSIITNLFGITRSKEGWLGVLRKYTDKPEERTWQILGSLDDAVAWQQFPDFDIACIRAAQPADKSEPGEWDQDLMEKGMETCLRKSNLLFDISANLIFQGKGREAFIPAIQAIHAAESISPRPGNHVYPFYFLFALFTDLETHTYGVTPITDLLKMHKPQVMLHKDQYTLIVELAGKIGSHLDQNLVAAAEEVLREKLPVRDRWDLFDAYS
jgi:hypothetical protein